MAFIPQSAPDPDSCSGRIFMETVAALDDEYRKTGHALHTSQLRNAADTLRRVLNDIRDRLKAISFPINSLPTDILSIIFQLCTAACRNDMVLVQPDHAWTELRHLPVRPLITITHVCRHWRLVALSLPSLWTRVDCHNPAQFFAFHDRSAPLPLSLFIHTSHIRAISIPDSSTSGGRSGIDKPLDSTDLNRFLTSLEPRRLRRLDVFQKYEPTGDEARKPPGWLVALHAPDIECVNVMLPFQKSDFYSERGRLDSVLLFQGRSNALKALAISEITRWFPANHFPNLSHIFLSFRNNGSAPLKQLLSLFANTPVLEISHITHYRCQTIPDRSFDDLSLPISLPRLRLMAFTRCSDWLLSILLYLDLPSQFLVRMNQAQLSDIGVPSLLTATRIIHGVELDVRALSYQRVHVALQGQSSGVWLQSMSLSYSDSDMTLWLQQFLSQFPSIGHPGALTSLTLDFAQYEVHMHMLPDLLAATPRLENLRMRTGFVWATREWCAALAPAGAAGAPCPALRTLAAGSKVAVLRENGAEDLTARAYARCVERMLSARAAGGCARLERLELQPLKAFQGAPPTYSSEDSSGREGLDTSELSGDENESESENDRRPRVDAWTRSVILPPLLALKEHVGKLRLVVLGLTGDEGSDEGDYDNEDDDDGDHDDDEDEEEEDEGSEETEEDESDGDAIFGDFKVGPAWRVEDEERYWSLRDDHRARFFKM